MSSLPSSCSPNGYWTFLCPSTPGCWVPRPARSRFHWGKCAVCFGRHSLRRRQCVSRSSRKAADRMQEGPQNNTTLSAGQMTLKALVPMAYVKSVRHSIEFYVKLGFTVGNTHAPEGGVEPVWAWLTAGGAQLMLAQATEPVDPGKQAVLFYVC